MNGTMTAAGMNDEQKIKAAIQEAMSPQAVGLMIAHLQCVDGNAGAHQEVAWFCKLLVELVGGPDAVNNIFEEIGV